MSRVEFNLLNDNIIDSYKIFSPELVAGSASADGSDKSMDSSSLVGLRKSTPTWGQCYKTFYGHNLQIFVIS
jgi:hypothetical protein